MSLYILLFSSLERRRSNQYIEAAKNLGHPLEQEQIFNQPFISDKESAEDVVRDYYELHCGYIVHRSTKLPQDLRTKYKTLLYYGVPDFLVITPDNHEFFVEVKSIKDSLSFNQLYWIYSTTTPCIVIYVSRTDNKKV